MFLLVVGILAFLNARLALKKGRNPYAWGFLSLFAFFVAFITVGCLYFFMLYDGALTREAMQAYMEQNILTAVMMEMLGVGGMLLVRFILERSRPRNGTNAPGQ